MTFQEYYYSCFHEIYQWDYMRKMIEIISSCDESQDSASE